MDRNNEDKMGDKHGRNGESSLSCFFIGKDEREAR